VTRSHNECVNDFAASSEELVECHRYKWSSQF